MPPSVVLLSLRNNLSHEIVVICFAWLVAMQIVTMVFTKKLHPDRKFLLRRQLRSCFWFAFVSATLLLIFTGFQYFDQPRFDNILGDEAQVFVKSAEKILGFGALGCCVLWIIKIARVSVFLIMFLTNPKRPVPLLFINVVTVAIGLFVLLYVASDILGFSLAPLLATSAFVSLVLGLALQDTLGNLLSGIALQFDRPFRIDDWIEVATDGRKTVGQVKEISWRAIVMQAFSDELITLPNRAVAQAQISNFSVRSHPVLRSHFFRLPFSADVQKVRQVLVDNIKKMPSVHKDPPPVFVILENGDSWVSCKLVYAIVNFSEQFRVGSDVIESSLKALKVIGVEPVVPQIRLQTENSHQ